MESEAVDDGEAVIEMNDDDALEISVDAANDYIGGKMTMIVMNMRTSLIIR